MRKVPLNRLTEGMGEKMLLRKVAKELGLEKSSTFKKKLFSLVLALQNYQMSKVLEVIGRLKELTNITDLLM